VEESILQFAEKQQAAKRYMDVSPFLDALAGKNVRFYGKLQKQLEKLFSK